MFDSELSLLLSELHSSVSQWLLDEGVEHCSDIHYGWHDEDVFCAEFLAFATQAGLEGDASEVARLWRTAARLASKDVRLAAAAVSVERLSVHGQSHAAAPSASARAVSPKRRRVLVPWRLVGEQRPPVVAKASSPSLPAVQDEKLPKLMALFRICAELFLDVSELGFPDLDWASDHAVALATSTIVRAASRLSVQRLGMLAATLRRWLRWAKEHQVCASQPSPTDLASFLRDVSLGGPTAAASVYQAFAWTNVNLGASWPIQHFMVQPFRFHAQGHCTQQAVELQPWEFVNMLHLAAGLTGTPQLVLCFLLQAASSCIRFAHFQRSRLVEDHGSWLEFQCSEGKSRTQGVRPPYRWASPRLHLGAFDVLAVLRKFSSSTLLPGCNFLWPALELQAADLWQITESTGVLLHKRLSPVVFLEFLRGTLQRCGVSSELASSATYNRLRRFLPTGANVLNMSDSEAQAIGSWVEVPRGGAAKQGRHRHDLMSVRYSGQRVLSSVKAKEQVLRAVPHHPLARAAEGRLLAPHSFMWHHIAEVPAAEVSAAKVNSSSGESSSSSSSTDSESGEGETAWPDVESLSAVSWFVQSARLHIAREVSCEDGRPIPWCRSKCFHQVPSRQGSDLSKQRLDVLCQRCVAAVPPALRASVQELQCSAL